MTHVSDESSPLRDSSREGLYESIRSLVDAGREPEAMEAIKSFLRLFPDYAEAHNDLAVLYYRAGNRDGTLTHYEEAVRLSPENSNFRKNLAGFYFVELGRRDEAIAIYTDLLKKHPGDAETLLALGIISRTAGLLHEARLFFRQVLQVEPGNVEARLGLQLVDEELLAAATPAPEEAAIKSEPAPAAGEPVDTPPQVGNNPETGSGRPEMSPEKIMDAPPHQDGPLLPGTIVWIAPFYNRSGFGVGARTNVLALYRAGARIRIASVNQVEEGIDDCDIALLKSLEKTPLIPPITAIFSHVPSRGMLDIMLPEPNVRILATTVFDCCAEGGEPPAEMLDVCRQMDQIWLHVAFERESFLKAGFPPEMVHAVHWPHHWFENPSLPPAFPEPEPGERPFRFLNISLFLPRRRWDTLIEAFLLEFRQGENVELYLKVNYPAWHPVAGKPRQDLLDLIAGLRKKTGSEARIVLDEELGARSGIVSLIDSSNVYVTTDTAATAPLSEARVRRRMVIMPCGMIALPDDWHVPIEVDPNAKTPLTDDMLLYQPNHKGSSMPLLHVHDVRQALRRAYDMPLAERRARAENASRVPGPSDTIPVMVDAIKTAWDTKNAVREQTAAPPAGKRITWEGPQLARHSLALVNRELCLRLMDAGYEVSIVPHGKDDLNPDSDPRFAKIAEVTGRALSAPADVHVRHQWPPDFRPPAEGHWINIQPWEYGSLPKEWLQPMSTLIDEMWVPSHFVRECYLRSGIPADRVFVVPNGVDTAVFNPMAAPLPLATSKGFRFLFVGGTIYRKGIDILLEAYGRAFSDRDDVCLVIKDMGGETFYKGQTSGHMIEKFRSRPGAPEIVYLDEMLDERELAGLYTACQCLVHPYRGEGFGLPIAEAMACGLPVVVTGYGAALDFCSGSTGWLLPARTVKIPEKKIGPLETADYPWLAEPDLDELCRAMSYAASDPAEARRRGENAAHHISTNFSWDNAAAILKKRLDALPEKPVLRDTLHETDCQKELLSIIIQTGSDKKAFQQCLESLRGLTSCSFQILVAGRSPGIDYAAWLPENKSGIRVLEDLRGTAACNAAIKSAGGEYICLMDEDVMVTPGWHEGMIECLRSIKDSGIVSPMSNRAEGIQQVPDFSSDDPAGLNAFAEHFRSKYRHRRIPVRQLDGFCLFFKKELAEEIGLLDVELGKEGTEGADFCLRTALTGCINLIAGDVFVHRNAIREDHAAAVNRGTKLFREKWSRPLSDEKESKKAVTLKALERAETCRRRGDNEQAVAILLNEGIRNAPEDKRLYHALAEHFLDLEQCRNAHDTLIEAPSEAREASHLVYLGRALAGMGSTEEAMSLARQALDLDPHFAPALHLLGTIAYCGNNTEEAENYWRKAKASDPGMGNPLIGLGLLARDRGEIETAVELMANGFRLSPLASETQLAFHGAVCEAGDLQLGESLFREARNLYAGHKGIHFLLIDLLLRQGKSAAALAEIEAAGADFGFDDGMLAVGLEQRKSLGPMTVPLQRQKAGTGVSLCMIIKNEAVNLPRCLLSLKPIVDEIIIVDTGSTDRSIEIAELFGAQVLVHQWTGDFSEARNVSLDHAGADWILVMDADEVISAADHEAFRRITDLGTREPTAYIIETRNYSTNVVMESWRPNDRSYPSEEQGVGWIPSSKIRLFPNRREIRFQGAVHELVTDSIRKAGVTVANAPIPVHHYGYLDRERQDRKAEEYYSLGKRKLAENGGDDFEALYELAVQAGAIGKYPEALDLWDRAIRINPASPTAHFNRAFVLLQLERYEEAKISACRTLELKPGHIDGTVNLAVCEIALGNATGARELLQRSLETKADHFFTRLLHSICQILTGREEEGIKNLKVLQNEGIKFDDFLNAFLDKLSRAGQSSYHDLLSKANERIS